MNSNLEFVLEIQTNVDQSELNRRTQICYACDNFMPSRYLKEEIINAVTGEKEIIDVYKFEDCEIDNISLTGFLSMKVAVCPEGKW
jgi:hypothetical protein